MADNYPRPYDAGSILDHPALNGLDEYLQEVHEADSISHFYETRFIGHERDITLQPNSIDSDEIEAIHQRQCEARCQRSDMAQAQLRREARQRRLHESGINPDNTRESAWDDLDAIVHTPRQGRGRGRSAYENTSLDDTAPELASNGPSHHPQCRSQGAEHLDYSELITDFIEDRLELLQEESEQREVEKKADANLDRIFDILAAKRLEIPALKMRIQILADEFRATDEETFRAFESHIFNAHKCSQSQGRIWSIAIFFEKGLPQELWRAFVDLASCELTISTYTLTFKRIQVNKLDTDGIDIPCCSYHTFCNDDTWQSAVQNRFPRQNIIFGDDYEHNLPNGFSDYQAPPEVNSIQKLVEHMTASLETRIVRVKHEADVSKRTALTSSFSKFTIKAQKIVDDELHKLLGGDFVPKPDELEQALADNQALSDIRKALRVTRVDLGLTPSDDPSDVDI